MSCRPSSLNTEKRITYLGIARRAALSSGKYLQKRKNLDVVSSHGKDIKLAADLESERIIVGVIHNESNIQILSEERGLIEKRNSDDKLMWIIDPLDGSYNYKKNIPLCCVSIALWNDNSPLLGVVYDFVHEEMFYGIVGQEAWLNDCKIQVGAVCNRSEAVMFTGFPLESNYKEKDLTDFVSETKRYKKVRLIGSAALSLVYVASGRADCYQEKGIMLWDVAGGLAILSAAGGKYLIHQYKDRRYCLSVSASNGGLDLVK